MSDRGPTIDTKRLRELAESATPGPWEYVPPHAGSSTDFVRAPDGHAVFDFGAYPPWRADADYIAAANPTTVLALLDEVERLRADAVAYSKRIKSGLRKSWSRERTDLVRAASRLAKQLAAANAEAERLRRERDIANEHLCSVLGDDLVPKAQLAAMTTARDEACEIARSNIDPYGGSGSDLARIDEIEKVGK